MKKGVAGWFVGGVFALATRRQDDSRTPTGIIRTADSHVLNEPVFPNDFSALSLLQRSLRINMMMSSLDQRFRSGRLHHAMRWGMMGCAAMWMVSSALTTQVLAQGKQSLMVRIIQDEPMRLPKDNTALFSAKSPDIQIELQYLADIGAPDETLLTLVTPDGQTQELASTGNGRFTLPNPISGLYAIVARSATAIATIPFYARNFDEDEQGLGDFDDEFVDANDTIQVPVISNGRDSVDLLTEQYVSYRTPTSFPPLQYDFQVEVAHGYQVRLGADGSLPGQVIIGSDDPRNVDRVAGNNIFLLQDGVRIQNVVSDENGAFTFPNLTPGIYGVVATGPGGFTAFSFEALAANAFAEKEAEQLSKAGFVINNAMEPVDILPVVMIPPELVPYVLEILREQAGLDAGFPLGADGLGTPIAGGGIPGAGPGGFGSGGGGGGFGGDLTGLATLAGLAGLLSSDVFDDDDNAFNPVPVVVSPASP